MRILITGAAGFLGKRLAAAPDDCVRQLTLMGIRLPECDDARATPPLRMYRNTLHGLEVSVLKSRS